MTALFGKPKPPKVTVPPVAKEEPPPPPPATPPPLPPPAKEAPATQGAEADVRRKERRRGRVATILTNPMGVVQQGQGKSTVGG
jgi:hypothetical protein